jgi:membrane protein
MSQSRIEPTGSAAPSNTAPADASVGELIKAMSADLSRLVRDEIQLAQTEISAKVKQAGKGVGAFGGAGVLALYGVAVLIAAAVLGLALVLPPWLAALIVGIVVLAIAGVAALVGKKQLSEAGPAVPEKTVASVKEDVAEIKESIQR